MIISLSRIFTKLLLSDEKENTIIFFFISIGIELMCFILHLLVKRTHFVRYYTACSREGAPEGKGVPDHGTGYRVHHDVTAEDVRFVSLPFCSSWAGVPGLLEPAGVLLPLTWTYCCWPEAEVLGKLSPREMGEPEKVQK